MLGGKSIGKEMVPFTTKLRLIRRRQKMICGCSPRNNGIQRREIWGRIAVSTYARTKERADPSGLGHIALPKSMPTQTVARDRDIWGTVMALIVMIRKRDVQWQAMDSGINQFKSLPLPCTHVFDRGTNSFKSGLYRGKFSLTKDAAATV